VRLDNLASFAIEEDIRTLLEESGYHPELVLMQYSGISGKRYGRTVAVLRDEEEAHNACRELDGAPLFDKRVKITTWDGAKKVAERVPTDLRWGWYATSSSRPPDLRHRAPLLSHPKNVSHFNVFLPLNS
jgi:hypothetical protein